MDKVQRRKLSDDVLERLLQAIKSSEFPPGSQMPSERELMSLVGVGRPSIREAMQALHLMGLIRVSQGERARVVEPTAALIVSQISASAIVMLSTNPDALDEIKEARQMTEIGLVRLAARRATAEDVKALGSSLDAMRSARGDDFIAADMEFHGRVADISGNSIVAAVVRGMLEWLTAFKRDMVSVKGAEKITLEEHRRILVAIEAHDQDAAEAAMRDHLARADALYAQLTRHN